MELRRHIDEWLIFWKNKPLHKPALIKGIRQSGKTHSITSFIEKNYEVIVSLNFWENSDLISVFDGSLELEEIIKKLSALVRLPILKKGSTAFFFDEIQECPRARLFLKTVSSACGYDFLASGSYLGIKGYVKNDNTPAPVGSLEEFDMRTLDFEEFLWAKGYANEQVALIKDAFEKRVPLEKAVHEAFERAFREYCCIGGFPEAVVRFIETNNINLALHDVRSIVKDLQDDFGRRTNQDGTPIFQPNEVARIRSAFALVPSFLAKENKRFIVSKIEGKGAKDKGKDALNYLIDAGVLTKVHNLSSPSLPLAINAIENQYKIFPTDIGMLVSMLEDGTTKAIISGEMGFAKGMLYEGIVAEALYKRGGRLFYFSKDTGLELDFVVNIDGESTILEVKAVDGNAKSAKTVLLHPEHYGKTRMVKITSSNVSCSKDCLTIPHYMAFLLFPWSDLLPE